MEEGKLNSLALTLQPKTSELLPSQRHSESVRNYCTGFGGVNGKQA